MGRSRGLQNGEGPARAGASMTAVTTSVLVCTTGHGIREGDRFCVVCGAPASHRASKGEVRPRSGAAGNGATDERGHISYVRDFITEARSAGLVGVRTERRLRGLLERREAELSVRPRIVRPSWVPSPPPLQPPRPAGQRPPPPPIHRPAPPPSSPPSEPPAIDWLGRARELVASELAVHGLAYLGVLLTFTGTFGLVYFAFGDVERALRPFAEAAIPLSMFGSGMFLHRRGAKLVAKALTVLGGSMLPVVLFASFVDGASLPPDLTGGALIAALAATSSALALLFGAWSIKHPDSALRYLTAPLGWAAALAVGFVFRPGALVGRDIQDLVAAQMALASAAVALTLVVSFRSSSPLAHATNRAAIPGAAATFLLTLLLGGTEGWPSAPLIVAGVATLASSELLARAIAPVCGAATIRAAIGAIVFAAAAQELGTADAAIGATIAFGALLEWQLHTRPGRDWPALAAAGGAAIAFAATEPAGSLIACGAASVWAHGRRVRPWRDPSIQSGWVTAAAAVLPIGAVAGLWGLTSADVATLSAAVLILGIAIGVRTRRDQDPFWAAYVPSAAGAAALAAVAYPSFMGTSPWSAAGAATLAATALALAPRWATLRLWSASIAGSAALALSLDAASVRAADERLVWTAVGLAAVVVAGSLRHRLGHHVAIMGHAVATVTLLGTEGDARGVAVVAAWTAGWIVSAVALERGRASFPRALALEGERENPAGSLWLDAIPASLVAISLPFLVLRAAGLSDTFAEHEAWSGVALACTGLAASGATRLLATKAHLGAPLAIGAVILGPVAIVAAIDAPAPASAILASNPLLLAASLGIATSAILARRYRIEIVGWHGWALSALVTVLAVHRAGVGIGDLHLVALGWGAVCSVGGLLLDDIRAGRRQAGMVVRAAWLRAPVVLGWIAIVIGYLTTWARGDAEAGWSSSVVAVLSLVIAWQLRLGWLSMVGHALAVTAYVRLWPVDPLEQPWLFIPASAALSVVALLAKQPNAGRSISQRWDVPPMIVAWATALVAVSLAGEVGWTVQVFAGYGALALVYAAATRHVAWEALGTWLLLAASLGAGHGWAAAVLASIAGWNAAISFRSAEPGRAVRELVVVAATGFAFAEMLLATDPTTQEVLVATALASGGVVLAVAALVRARILTVRWASGWIGLALLGPATALTLSGSVERAVAWNALGASIGAFALAAALLAAPLRLSWLRETAAAIAIGSLASFSLASSPSAMAAVVQSIGAAGAATGLGLILWRFRPRSVWYRPLALVGMTFGVLAVMGSAALWPQRGMLVAALVLTAMQTVIVAGTLGVPRVVYLAPPQLCAAWIVFASEALAGTPEWFTIPIGLTLLVLVGLVRRSRARLGESVGTPDIVTLEIAGVAFLSGASLAQTVTESGLYGLLATFIGGGVMTWGALTRVRRRAIAGAAVSALAATLLIGAPMARLIPELEGASLWITVALAGAALIVVAAFVERARADVAQAIDRLGSLTRDWE